MHFSIPDTSECSDTPGSSYTLENVLMRSDYAYTPRFGLFHSPCAQRSDKDYVLKVIFMVYNLHINGAYHCSVRYRQLHGFHEQLKKEFGAPALPPFPPKKLLPLSLTQLEDRRCMIERFIQIVSQNPVIGGSTCFNSFLLNAQQESLHEKTEDVTLDIHLMNGHKITVSVLSTDQTDAVLEAAASQIELTDELVYYFGLYLIKKEDESENAIVRKFQEFESPYISLKSANSTGTHRIVLRKSYWDPTYDEDLIEDRIAKNLLYVQAVSDVQRGWVLATKEQLKQLMSLQHRGSKKEYLRLVSTLKYYGYLQFKPCVTDYPKPNCRVIVSAGIKELNFRVQIRPEDVREISFKVTRMRCWRITTSIPETEEESDGNSSSEPVLDLAFEYLVAKDKLQWITITSEQAILISMCLQSMVDELIMKKEGRRFKRPQDRKGNKKLHKDAIPVSNSSPTSPTEPYNGNFTSSSSHVSSKTSNKKFSNKFTAMPQGSTDVGNHAFEQGIGDDDL